MLRSLLICMALFQGSFIWSQVDAIFNQKTFNSPSGTYVESYIYLYAKSLTYVLNSDSVPKCSIEITQIVKTKDTDSIITFQKYTLVNPETSINDLYDDMVDVKRIQLPNNRQYELEIIVKDKNNPRATEQSITNTFSLNYKSDHVEISDIQLITNFTPSTEETVFTKSGMKMVPMVGDFYSDEYERIAYYFEIYNTLETFGKEGKFLITHYIENTKTKNVAGVFQKNVRGKVETVVPILYYFDIKSLPTGDYELVAQVKDDKNQLITEKRTPFRRVSNTINMELSFIRDVEFENSFVARMPVDSLEEYIYCLSPIAGVLENRMMANQMSSLTETEKRQFIYSFWINQDYQNPEMAWEGYLKQVKLVHQMFGTKVKRGYETDRGRIYLKYGPPNKVDDRPNEPSAYPYQMWHYYKIGQFNNKRFIFYLPDLVTNDYALLHSDLQGEIQNFKWERDLNKRNSQGGDIDDANEGNFNSYGTNSRVLFRNP
jgi:GWxTD domain-containing protein